MSRALNDRATWFLSLPGLGYLLLFFAVPTVLVVLISFKSADIYGGTDAGWTMAAWGKLVSPGFGAMMWRTLWLSFAATLACLLIGVPCAYFMAKEPPRRRQIWLMLVVLPFWTSFLVRILAWKVLLHPEGLIKQVLVALGLVDSGAVLLYNPWSVLLVLIYTNLPFAILPLYSSAEKFDFALLDAARDLGANGVSAFLRVFVPGISQGLAAAVIMVLIPALGCYVIPDLVGGPSGEMLGNKIAQRTFSDRNLPLAAALATSLILLVFLPMMVLLWRKWRERPGGLV